MASSRRPQNARTRVVQRFKDSQHAEIPSVDPGAFSVPKRGKYGAVATTVNGIRFASKAESERYQQLIIAERAGKIRALVLQPAWPLIVEGVKVATYRADFSYIDVATDTEVVEDVKGMSTPVYKLKKKMMAAFYGIEIQEIRA